MRGNLESCPKCGLMARTVEGTFNVRDGLVEVLDAPQWTRDAFTQARRALEDLALGKDRTQAAAIRELEKTSPLAAELVSKAWSRGDKIAICHSS